MTKPSAWRETGDRRETYQQLLRDDLIGREAFNDYARDRTARDHFRERVAAFPGLNKTSVFVATVLAGMATAKNGRFEIVFTRDELAARTRLSCDSIRDAVVALCTAGLIEILQPGSGRGRPSRVCLVIEPQHEAEIAARARNVIQERIAAVEHRVAVATAIST